ncbi:MAG: hypothetical protein H6Q33_1551, partial [Deltaproteobacteria bacterium]|nr:hypothetical protein [Deltaproteobacteria bacterium]
EVRFTRLIDVAEQTRDAPVAQVAIAPIAGRAGTVALQGPEHG